MARARHAARWRRLRSTTRSTTSSPPSRRWRARSPRELRRAAPFASSAQDRPARCSPSFSQRRGHAGDAVREPADPRRKRAAIAADPSISRSPTAASMRCKLAGVFDDIERRADADARPFRSSTRTATAALQPYGQRPNEVIYLHLAAAAQPGAARRGRAPAGRASAISNTGSRMRISSARSRTIRDLRSDRLHRASRCSPLLATDGAGSLLRRRMAAAGSDRGPRIRSRAWLQGAVDSAGSRAAAIGWSARRCTSGRAATTC